MSAFLTIGLNDKGEKVNIDDAAHGKACNCFCPICHKPLIARNSKPLNEAKRVHHFAHSKGCNCEASDETVLHKLAKQIILEEKALMLPTFDSGNKPSGLIHFQSVEQEKWNNKYGFRPDIEAVMENGEIIFVEFFVSHKVTSKKRRIITDNRLSCIEIDLNYVEIDKEALRSFLIEEDDNRTWIVPIENKGVSKESFSYTYRNPWREKAIEYIKDRFERGILYIGQEVLYNLRQFGYDICEPIKMYRGFRTDLLLYRSQKKDKACISINIKGRRRNEFHKTPRNLRIIDIIIRDELGYSRLIGRNNLCADNSFIIYEGFNFKTPQPKEIDPISLYYYGFQ